MNKNLLVSKENRPVLVIDTENDSTIKKMISNATSKEIKSYIAIELEDIKVILNAEGLTSTISTTGRGKFSHKKSIQPLIMHYKICKNIRAILISFSIHGTFSITKIKEVMGNVYKVFTKDEEIIFSVFIDNTLALDEVQVNSIIKR